MNSNCSEIKSNNAQKSVGKLLKQARQKHKVKDLNVIARELCIKPYLLEALELDNFGSFPSSCYATGFLKNYSNYLGLDAQEITAIYEHEYVGLKESAVLTFPEAEKHNNFSLKGAAWAATFSVAILVGVWSSYDNSDAEEISPLVVANKLNTTNETVSSNAIIPVSEVEAKKEAPQINPTNMADVHLKAKDDVWIRISQDDGTVLVDKILTKGEDLVPPKAFGLNLMTNNAAALTVFVGSNAIKPLGGEGEIVRNIVLEQEKLQNLSMLD
ncbi:MAG: DUF4115 domain-containing protein [Kordiimonadaceae bacterium]|nr:DUF4115 domain-containing protein [Kordiimonadaceae bacterium]MBT6033291.1 DUF4115 domain-containing protein [Kordiimonadaceae bacterium]